MTPIFYCISLGLNLIFSFLIVFRLLHFRRKIRKHFDRCRSWLWSCFGFRSKSDLNSRAGRLHSQSQIEENLDNVNENVGSRYLSIAAMLIESAMLYTVFWTGSVVPMFLRSSPANLFAPGSVYVQVRSCFPYFYLLIDLGYLVALIARLDTPYHLPRGLRSCVVRLTSRRSHEHYQME